MVSGRNGAQRLKFTNFSKISGFKVSFPKNLESDEFFIVRHGHYSVFMHNTKGVLMVYNTR